MKILFQGDSITDAHRKPEELNLAYQLGNGYVFMVAARLAVQHPASGLVFINRGRSGDRVVELEARWKTDALDIEPDVVSLLVGVNDTIRAMRGREALATPAFLSTYRRLLDQLYQRNPRVKLILIEPFLLETGIALPEWRTHLRPRQEGIAGIATEYGVPLIPMQQIFDDAVKMAPPSYWMHDGVHPSHAGFQLIADAWLKTAVSLLDL